MRRLFISERLLLLLLLLSHFSHVRLCATPQMAAHQAPHPWDSPGKNTGVGCHVILQCMKVKSESEVAQSCPTLSDPMDCSLPDSSVHGIFQARLLEWGAIAFSVRKIGMTLNITLACWYFCICVCVCVFTHTNDADMSYVNPKIFNKICSQFSKIWRKVVKMWKQQSHESPEGHETAMLFLTSG